MEVYRLHKKVFYPIYKIFFIALFVLFWSLLNEGIAFADKELTYDWFWVFYEYERDERMESEVFFRPFFLRNIYTDRRVFEASLLPVYWRNKTPRKDEKKFFLGLWSSVNYVHPSGVEDKDVFAFPLMYGESPYERDRYFFLWPFGGTIKGKLVQDRISAYAFPGFLLFFLYPPSFPPTWTMLGIIILSLIPVYVDYEYKDYKAWGILWPLIQRGKSPTRDDKRFLPFYAHNYKRDQYDNYSYLLIFNCQKLLLKDDVQNTFFAFPFFGRRWSRSENMNASTLLWPFFSWGYNKKRGAYELNFPWPLVQVQDSQKPYIKKRIYFPFYGIYEFRNQSTFFITPFYFTLKKQTKNFDSEYYFYAIIIWHFKRDYKKEPSPTYGRSWRYYKIWPLFQYEYDDRGNYSFNLLSLLFWRDPDGYEKMYQPFWTLFEYRTFQSGEKRLGLLLRTYYQRWGEDFLYIKIPLLFSYARSNGRLVELSFLLRMFSYSDDSRGEYLRLLWIPIRLGDGHANDDMEGVEEDDSHPITDTLDYSYHGGMYHFYGDFNRNEDWNKFVIYRKNLF
jgi:hypothetical protein